VFDPKKIVQRMQQMTAVSGRIDSASGEKPGVWAKEFAFPGLHDYLVSVEVPEGSDLDLAILDGPDSIRGLGTTAGSTEAVIISFDFSTPIAICILNRSTKSTNFGLSIHEIVY
jgi:hypothetical protein